MATKPTVRIPLWASGGTRTDPGGGKEATGWLPDERPPANWWNWVWNAMGQWAEYFETVTDQPLPIAVGRVQTGATPSVVFNSGPALAATPAVAAASTVTVNFASPIITAVGNSCVQLTQENVNTTRIIKGQMQTTSQLAIIFNDTDGVSITDVNSVIYRIHYAIWGTPA